jgi:predicted transcriptional regulator
MLEEKGLIEKEGDLYVTTEKGKKFQERARDLKL